MPRAAKEDTFLSALDESFHAMRDAVRAGNKRGFRLSKRLVGEIRDGQQELTRLARRFAQRPSDMSALYHDSVGLATRGTSHASLLAQELLAGAREAGEDLRGTTKTLVRANRRAAQALAAAVQSTAGDLARRARRRPRARPAPKRRRAVAAKAARKRAPSRRVRRRPPKTATP